jgi:hypothetical protein
VRTARPSRLALTRLALTRLALTLLAACAPSVTEIRNAGLVEGDHGVVTDARAYSLRPTATGYEGTVTAVYVNRSRYDEHYALCVTDRGETPMYSLWRTGPDSTRPLHSEIRWGTCAGSVPTGMLRPGESLVFRVPLGATDRAAVRPEALVGTMRVRVHLCAANAPAIQFCQPMTQQRMQSNAFEVRF